MQQPPQRKTKTAAQKERERALPWTPPESETADIYAIKALAAGTATPEQQERAWLFILRNVCKTWDLSFRPDEFGGARATDFAEGKRYVGLQLVHISKLILNKQE